MSPLIVGGRTIFGALSSQPTGITTTVGSKYFDTSNNAEYLYTGTEWQSIETSTLGSQGNPASSAEELRLAGITNNGVYYISTPDGGTQQVYCMFTTGSSQGGDYGWMLIARYAADGKNTVRDILASTRGLKDVSQSGTSYWSADFGTYTITEARIIGCSDASDWMSNRTTDWIYQVPSSQNAIRFFTNQTDYSSTSRTNFGSVQSGPKRGNSCAGARDGRGRWTNSSYVYHRISDEGNSLSTYCRPGYFSAPGADMWSYNGAGDAKWSVSATAAFSGQDTDSSALVGWDDNNGPAWYDANTGSVAQDSSRVDNSWNSALFVFIR